MLTHEEIVKAVAKAATQFSLEKVSYSDFILECSSFENTVGLYLQVMV